MRLRILEESVENLGEYGQVAISFQVETQYSVNLPDNGLGGMRLKEERIQRPYLKDYDALKGEGPTRWMKKWDISHWGVLSAFYNELRIGGAVVAYDTEGVDMLEGKKDLAALWDLRVQPEYRGQGVGTKLFQRAVSWARDRGCRVLKIETQNINVPACRFYRRQGCELGVINRYAYRELPQEVQLIWYRNIPGKPSSGQGSRAKSIRRGDEAGGS